MPALAQSRATAPALPPAFETRPAIPSAAGDTGLWFVPAAEVLPAGRWSMSAYRVNTDYDQGFTDVSNWPIAAGAGVGGRAELFAALTIVNRIDRDVRPVVFTGGVVNEYPFVTDGWTGSNLGDLRLGAKLNLASQSRGSPAAIAIRADGEDPDRRPGHRRRNRKSRRRGSTRSRAARSTDASSSPASAASSSAAIRRSSIC